MKDLIGKSFGLLTVLSKNNKRASNGGIIYKCICRCGRTKNIRSSSLLANKTKSCGCIRNKFSSPIKLQNMSIFNGYSRKRKPGIDQFIELYKKGFTIKECQEITGYNKGLAYRYAKDTLTEIKNKKKKCLIEGSMKERAENFISMLFKGISVEKAQSKAGIITRTIKKNLPELYVVYRNIVSKRAQNVYLNKMADKAIIIETFVNNPNLSTIEIGRKLGFSHMFVAKTISLYMPIKFGETITLQSKIND